jgi:thiamine pyrophosphokinase
MIALIVTGGESPSGQFLAELGASADIVIAADSGLDTALAAGISPRLVLGDFDSISDRKLLDNLSGAAVLEYKTDKDDTDTELALAEAARRGFDRILLCGAGGGRLDHLMGILELFKRPLRPSEWYTSAESVHLIMSGSQAVFRISVGNMVSVFPLASPCTGMDSKGLKWTLEGLKWGAGEYGISNLALEPEILIKAGSADLLAVLPRHIRRSL